MCMLFILNALGNRSVPYMFLHHMIIASAFTVTASDAQEHSLLLLPRSHPFFGMR
jgi:hypothetical protein